MARNEQKRQKKLEKKSTKRKKTLQTIKKKETSSNLAVSERKQVLLAARSPIYQSLIPAGLFEMGIGNLIISRKMGEGYLGVSFFLVDVYCLGIKSAYFRVLTELQYQSTIRHLSAEQEFKHLEPACLYKLVEEAQAYATELGFTPDSDYQMARQIFGDIDPSTCQTKFVFGKEGKPFYFAGPHDSTQKSRQIIDTLTKRCGHDGFHYLLTLGLDDEFSGEEDFEQEDFIAHKLEADAGIPTNNFIAGRDLNDYGRLEEILEDLISAIKNGYFLCWEAVMREEQNLPLSPKQAEVIEDLISFNDNDEERILYIDEIPRPHKPWYEIVREVVPYLLVEPLKTSQIYYGVVLEGWPNLVECLTEHAEGLSLPEAINSPINVVPIDIQHKLWLQYCFDALHGLGQDEELTLANPEQLYRIELLIERLAEHLNSIEFFNLSLEKFVTMVIMPKQDEEIFIKLMLETLKMSSIKQGLMQYIKPIK
jgi:hypothetical protein